MQILIRFHNTSPFTIPLNYNYQVQSSIYKKLHEVGQSDFWHDVGIGDLQHFKTFVFGRLLGSNTISGKNITFHEDISLEIRSPIFSFCDALQRAIEQSPQIRLFDRQFSIEQCCLANQHLWYKQLTIQIVIKQNCDDGKSIYYGPDCLDYSQRINKNYINKYNAVFGNTPKDISISPVRSIKKTVTTYKQTWITAYDGIFMLEGDIPYLEFLYNCGLGEKNAQGFGMFTVINR